ncbi:MAG: hypothetical protein ABIJ21_06220 [Nanoarchaeota archaeon]
MKLKIILPLIGVLVVAFIISLLITRANTDEEKINTAKCLTAQGFAMAGTSWCPHCEEQKEIFGSAFQYIDYYDCDLEAQWCEEKHVEGYPSWVSPTGAASAGVKNLATLKKMSGCE